MTLVGVFGAGKEVANAATGLQKAGFIPELISINLQDMPALIGTEQKLRDEAGFKSILLWCFFGVITGAALGLLLPGTGLLIAIGALEAVLVGSLVGGSIGGIIGSLKNKAAVGNQPNQPFITSNDRAGTVSVLISNEKDFYQALTVLDENGAYGTRYFSPVPSILKTFVKRETV